MDDDQSNEVSVRGATQFAKAPIDLLVDGRLTPTSKVLYLLIRSYADESKPASLPFPSQVVLAERLGVVERTIRRSLDQLLECGWVQVIHKKRRGGGWPVNHYVLEGVTARNPTSVSGSDPTSVAGRDPTPMSDEPESFDPESFDPEPPTFSSDSRDAFAVTGPGEGDSEFCFMWARWPNKTGQAAAFSAWRRLKQRRGSRAALGCLDAVVLAAQTAEEHGTEGKLWKLVNFIGAGKDRPGEWEDWSGGRVPEGTHLTNGGKKKRASVESVIADVFDGGDSN